MRQLIITAALAVLASGTVLAQDAAPTTANPGSDIGVGTAEWLNLQKSGASASTVARPMPGDVADKVYGRYADSFAHPIPEKFEREKVSANGNGGG